MKLSKFVKRAKSESYCMVIHADDSGIWLGTRLALYNATELPEMEGKEQVGAVLDIDSKAWEKMFFDEKYAETAGAAFGVNLTNADPLEQEARRVPLEMFYKGMGLVGLMYGNAGELIFYDSALIAPIADVVKNSDYIQTVVRKTAGGAPYVVIKDGFEVLAGFVPLKIIYLNAAEFGWDWKQPLTVKEAENTLLEQNKDWKKKESDVYAQKELLEQHQKNLQLEKQNAECTVDKLKTWRAGIEKDPLWGKSVTYLREQSLDFDWNKRLHSLLLQSAEENSKIGDLQEKMNQITEISHSSIEALNTARTRAQKALQNQQKIFSEIAALVEKPEPRIEDLKQAREICVFEQEQKQTQISKLGNVIYSEGVSESIRKYNEYKTKIESLEHKIVTRKQALQKAQEALEAEKKTLLAELQKYFQQPLFNEIYQKIDPHPYMKKVSYEIMYNDEKNEPELYIKTLADKREPYHPELFFSTAQLNTVALSSFLSRALSLTEIPIGTIVIDDPVGHFDDMNILGFADLMRSIIEKSQKQIVITTHDETVYQIFRRKLPPEIYSSRFIDMTAE